MVEAVATEGIPTRVSYSAGTFVCNDLMYILLKRFRDTAVRVGFIHIPRAPIQGEPSMETETAARAIIAAIGAI
jgi:pyroglutamyl-peptidase